MTKKYVLQFENNSCKKVDFDGYSHNPAELLCSIINEADDYRRILTENNSRKISDLQEKLHESAASENCNSIEELLQDNRFVGELANNLENEHILYPDWKEASDIRNFAEKLRAEIFSFPVIYSAMEHSLLFLESDKPIVASNLADTPFIKGHLYASPYQHAVQFHFDRLMSELHDILKTHSLPMDELNLLQKLYIDSAEFLNYQFVGIMKHYLPEHLIKNQFQTTGNNLRSLVADFPTYMKPQEIFLSRSFLYEPNKLDFITTYIQDNADKYAEGILSTAEENIRHYMTGILEMSDSDYSKFLSNFQSSIRKNNQFFKDVFYTPEENGYLVSANFEDGQFIICYGDFSSHAPRNIFKAQYNNPVPKDIMSRDDFPIQDFNTYALFFGGKDSSVMSHIMSGKIDIMSYLSNLKLNDDDKYASIGKNAERLYDTGEADTIRTDSLGKVLICLIRSLNTMEGTSRIRRCPVCRRFFLAKNGYMKYCDAALDEGEKPPLHERCSSVAKRVWDQNRSPKHKKLNNLRRDQQKHFDQMYLYYTDPDYYSKVQNENYARIDPLHSLKDKDDIDHACFYFIDMMKVGALLNIYDSEKRKLSEIFEDSSLSAFYYETESYSRFLLPGKIHDYNNIPFSENYEPYNFDFVDGSLLKEKGCPTGFDWKETLSFVVSGQDGNTKASSSRWPELHESYKVFSKWHRKEIKRMSSEDSLSQTTKDVIRFFAMEDRNYADLQRKLKKDGKL